MNNCPKCSAELNDSDTSCSACGLSFLDESAKTAIKPPDDTPTEIKETNSQESIHVTTSDGSRFVAGTVLAGRYRIISILGKGGMGEVYKAEDLELDQTVALKFLPEKFSKNEDLLKRFRGEVRTARQVSHPNVCRVFDIGEVEGLYYISMEFIEGDDLSVLLNRIGRLPSDKAIEVSRQICLGLGAIHKAGILHRDLKPANIIIDQNGEARITDFGIAGIESEVQGAEAMVGTPAYMSPEQITGKEVTKSSDIYSLGLLLYEIFTGKQAFEGASFDELIKKHQTTNPTTPSEIVTGIDPVVETLIEKCLSKEPKGRPESALRVAMSLPGGDPLQVALEAGETPTPEMVAAAPKKGILKPGIAFALLAGFIGLFALTLFFTSVYTDAGWSPLYKSSDDLAAESRMILKDLGHETANTTSEYEFNTDSSYDFHITGTNTVDSLEKYRTGQPYAVYFWYRQSSLPFESVIGGPTVDERKAIQISPGSEYVRLDPKGRLIEFWAVPDEVVPATRTNGSTSWDRVFSHAGLDLEDFRKADPERVPPFFGGKRTAWTGTLADHPDVPIRIEAASFQGRPVFFKVTFPWEVGMPSTQEAFRTASIVVGFSAVSLAILGGLFLAYRNFRAKKTDIIGASKTAVFVSGCYFFSGILSVRHQTTFELEMALVINLISVSLLLLALILVLYFAVEPLVRRWWPELLISWNRLLTGDFRDPIVGRDFLIGGILGGMSVSVFFVAGLVRDFLYDKELTRQTTSGINSLNGIQELVSYLLISISFPVYAAFIVMTLLVVLYLILRSRNLAAITLAVMWGAGISLPFVFNRGIAAAAIQFVVTVIVAYLYSRYGVFTIFASVFISWITALPITFDPSRPYFGQTIFILLLGILLATFAAYVSLGKQQLFETRSIEELKG